MKNFLRTSVLAIATVASVGVSSVAVADSMVSTGASGTSATARLDFKIIIPQFIRFQVGSATAGSIDQVEFDMTTATNAPKVGDGTEIARTNGTTVPVKLQSNAGNVTLKGTTLGKLTNADGDEISYAEILPSSSDTDFDSPILVDGADSAAITIVPTSGKVVDRTANWTFKYKNSAIVAAGTYGSFDNTNNGRVVYTASLP